MRAIDTNVFIRFLTGDDPVKEAASRVLFQRLDAGEEEVFAAEAVVAEIIYVLTSKNLYNLSRQDTVARLKPTLGVRGLRMSEKGVAMRALDVYLAHPWLDFEDALSVAHVESGGLDGIVSYDEGFDRVAGVGRVEP